MITLSVSSDDFELIFSDIKQRYLSNLNFPKLIVGTGLSMSMNIPGMSQLSKNLDEKFNSLDDFELKNKWNSYKSKISKEGLEAALLDVSTNEEKFVEKIKEITSEFILNMEYKEHSNIKGSNLGFEKLLNYLIRTVSVNNPLIDIMTPNYDRIIELLCDKLNITSILGFSGNIYQSFDSNVLKKPFEYYSKDNRLIRVFKPHGSINWIKTNHTEYQVNDYEFLLKNKSKIDIITPGGMKYKFGMINDVFRCHREIFNELITDSSQNFSIFIYGYGFNDQHFNTVFENTKKDVIVLTRTIKSSVLRKALENKNWTVLYQNEARDMDDTRDSNDNTSGSFMIYKCNKYKLDEEVWDINVFAKIFLG